MPRSARRQRYRGCGGEGGGTVDKRFVGTWAGGTLFSPFSSEDER